MKATVCDICNRLIDPNCEESVLDGELTVVIRGKSFPCVSTLNGFDICKRCLETTDIKVTI